MAYSYNKNREAERKVNGAKQVYGGKPEVTLPGGYNLYDFKDRLPNVGELLPQGTPIACDDLTRYADIHYAWRIHSAATATDTQIQVKKDWWGSTMKVGRVIGFFASTETDAETMVAPAACIVTAVDSSNKAYDIITLSAALGAAVIENDILIELNQTFDTNRPALGVRILPTATTFDNIPIYGDEVDQWVDGVHVCNVLYVRRVPPIHPAIRAFMYRNGYFVRFFEGR